MFAASLVDSGAGMVSVLNKRIFREGAPDSDKLKVIASSAYTLNASCQKRGDPSR